MGEIERVREWCGGKVATNSATDKKEGLTCCFCEGTSKTHNVLKGLRRVDVDSHMFVEVQALGACEWSPIHWIAEVA